MRLGMFALMRPRHNVHGRALRCDYKVHAGGTRHLREAADRVLHLVRRAIIRSESSSIMMTICGILHGLSVFVLIIVRLREGVVAL